MSNKFDFIVLGGGSGGIAAANRAAEYGAKVLLIEAGPIGGTCVNVGCVPKKIMWMASQRYSQIQTSTGLGFAPLTPSLDWPGLVEKRQNYIHKLHAGYEKKLNHNNVVVQKGEGRFHSAHSIVVNETVYNAPHILIATGSRAIWPQIAGQDLGIDSDGFFKLKSLPKRVAIIGAPSFVAELFVFPILVEIVVEVVKFIFQLVEIVIPVIACSRPVDAAHVVQVVLVVE